MRSILFWLQGGEGHSDDNPPATGMLFVPDQGDAGPEEKRFCQNGLLHFPP